MKLRKDRIFIVVSILFLLALSIFYTYRLIHYYNIEKNMIEEATTLYDKIINSKTYSDNQGLFEIDNAYVYKGQVTNNYILYSGRLWRVISINKDKELKMVTESVESSLVWGFNSNYETSYIRSWLNKNENLYSGIFYNSLNNPENNLLKTNNCIDKWDKVDDMTCENNYNEDYISLLSGNDYKTAGGTNSFLNIESNFWLINATSVNKAWFITESGGYNNIVNINNTYEAYGIRPVITINSDIDLVSGNGTEDNPYIFENEVVNNLKDISVGTFVKYNNYTWKIVSKDSEKVKIVLNGTLKNNDIDIILPISENKASFDKSDKSNIAYYLNNDFYNSLENKDYIIKSKWYTGQYNFENKYDYKEIFDGYEEYYVGLLSIGDLFINNIKESFLTTKTDDIDDTFYYSDKNDTISTDIYTSKLKVRPGLYLDGELTIVSGAGSVNSPYELSR